jgi:hypothetical protein
LEHSEESVATGLLQLINTGNNTTETSVPQRHEMTETQRQHLLLQLLKRQQQIQNSSTVIGLIPSEGQRQWIQDTQQSLQPLQQMQNRSVLTQQSQQPPQQIKNRLVPQQPPQQVQNRMVPQQSQHPPQQMHNRSELTQQCHGGEATCEQQKQQHLRLQGKRKEREMEQQINHLQESILELEKTQLTNAKVSIAETMKHNSKKNKKSDGNEPKRHKTTSSSTCNKVTKKKASNKKNEDDLDIEEHSDNESSVDDGVDYTKEENYAVKKFIGHSEVKKKGKGKGITLKTRWKGWRDKDSITMEPLQNMVEDWPEKVKEYCEKNREMKDICHRDYGHLFE